MWAITYTVNDYGQYGTYIMVAWADKPDLLTFRKVVTKIDSDFYNDPLAADDLFLKQEYKGATEPKWSYKFQKLTDGEGVAYGE